MTTPTPAPPPILISTTVAEIVTFWRPGSQGDDWTWADEYGELVGAGDDERTHAIAARVDREGIHFADHVAPVLLGTDGRVWDGHHRICIAIHRGIHSLMCEHIFPPAKELQP